MKIMSFNISIMSSILSIDTEVAVALSVIYHYDVNIYTNQSCSLCEHFQKVVLRVEETITVI